MSAVDYSAYPGERFQALRYSNYWYAPEEALRRQCGTLYKNFPFISRCVWTPLTFFTGGIKPLIFPIQTIIGIIALPLIASICFVLGFLSVDKDTRNAYFSHGEGWLKAWCFTLIAVASLATFLLLAIYVFPLMVPATLIIGCMGVSIAIHIQRALLDPPRAKE